MTKAEMAVFDGELSNAIKLMRDVKTILEKFESKDKPHAYTQAIRKISEDLRCLQDRVRDDWR